MHLIIFLWFVWISINCDLKMDKQDLHNSNSATRSRIKNKTKIKSRYESKKTVLK